MRRLLSWAVKGAAALAALLVLLSLLYLFVPPVSTLMLWRWVTFERVERQWRPLTEISPNLVRAVLVAEDSRFCTHRGVDWTEVREAIAGADDLSEARGASTIAMQTARNLFLWPGRHFIRKAMEAPIALYLTLIWPRERMVEVYLNIAEWGPDGEFGAEAAARRAFGKSARSLTPHEAALLATSLPNPIRRNAARPGPGLQRLAARNVASVARDGGLSVRCLERG